MQPDDKPPIPTDDRSSDPRTLSDEERWAKIRTMSDEDRWAEKMKPFRQQNLTPEQRKALADTIRWSRRLRFLGIDVATRCSRPWIDD
jgi:hypothetical protein